MTNSLIGGPLGGLLGLDDFQRQQYEQQLRNQYGGLSQASSQMQGLSQANTNHPLLVEPKKEKPKKQKCLNPKLLLIRRTK